jgi:hypothetical protein
MEDIGYFLLKFIMGVTSIMSVIAGTVLVMMQQKLKEPEKKVVDDGLSTDDEELEPTCNMCGIKYTTTTVDIKEPGSNVYTKINNVTLTNCALCNGKITKKSKYDDYERSAILSMNEELAYQYLIQSELSISNNGAYGHLRGPTLLRTLVNEYKLSNPDSEDPEMKKNYIKKLQKDRNAELLKKKMAAESKNNIVEESKNNIVEESKNNTVQYKSESKIKQALKKILSETN